MLDSKVRYKSIIIAITLIISFLGFNTKVLASESIDSKDTKAVVLMDQGTGKILYEKDKDKVLPQASVTKLMTYYITMDYLKENKVPLSKKVIVGGDFSKVPSDGTKANLEKGDVITIDDLLSSLLILSANDSAIELEKIVEDATGQNFLKLMNEKAKELGLNNTVYINTSGLTETKDNKKVFNTTTAYETALLSKKIIDEYPEVLKKTSMKSFTYKDVSYHSTNKLIFKNTSVDGLKTGFTNEAGYCLASTKSVPQTSEDNKPFRLIGVTLGSSEDNIRTNLNLDLLNYGQANFENKKVLGKEKIFDIKSEYYKGGKISGSISDDLYYLMKKSNKIEINPQIKEGLKKNIKKGDVIGTVTIKIDKITLTEDLMATKDFKRVGAFKRIELFFKNMFK